MLDGFTISEGLKLTLPTLGLSLNYFKNVSHEQLTRTRRLGRHNEKMCRSRQFI